MSNSIKAVSSVAGTVAKCVGGTALPFGTALPIIPAATVSLPVVVLGGLAAVALGSLGKRLFD